MQFTRKQFSAIFVLISVITLSSGLCYGLIASAQVIKKVSISESMSDMGNCGEPIVVQDQIKDANPLGGPVMLCCVDRHDNTPTIVPTAQNDRVNFSDAIFVVSSTQSASFVQEPTYTSSSGPPACPDVLSSVFKKE